MRKCILCGFYWRLKYDGVCDDVDDCGVFCKKWCCVFRLFVDGDCGNLLFLVVFKFV